MIVESNASLDKLCRLPRIGDGSASIVSYTMKKLLLVACALNFALFSLQAAPPDINPSHIDAYITPYYNSKGPEVSVGRFSSGLASAKEDDFLTTIAEMKKDWNRLTFPELYVAAIRLYDLGYRKEAVYWFYSA